MTFLVLSLLLPVVLAIHNFDEYARYDGFVRIYHSRLPERVTTRRVVRNAAILLTLAVAALGALTYTNRSPFLVALSKVTIFALLVNGIGHCITSLKRRTLVPGTLTAITLVLPYSVIALVVMRTNLGDSGWSLLRYAAFGALAIPLATISFLWLGYGVSRLTTREESDSAQNL